MPITNPNDRQIAIGQSWFAETVAECAEDEFVRSDAENHRRADVIPTARAAAKIDAAAIGDESRFDLGVGRTQHDRIILEVGIHVTRRRQQFFKEFVARSVRLAQRCFAPEVGPGRECLFERGPRGTCGSGGKFGLQTLQRDSEGGDKEHQRRECHSLGGEV